MILSKPIKRGALGAVVTSIQNFLIGQGFMPGLANGSFGPITEGAVKAYQAREMLVSDGIVGNITLGRMLTQGLALMTTPDTATVGTYPPGFPSRPDFSPLTTNAERGKVFGLFRFVPAPVSGNAEAIKITDDWDDKNIVLVKIPQLAKLKLSETGNARMHRLVESQTLALWLAWEMKGLLPHVKSWEGMYVPRFIRGSRSTLSNHAFGSAFDINYTGNELGRTPAAFGTPNSVRELVPLAHRFGFYWGGHFGRADGMHFEVAKVMTGEEVASVLNTLKV